ncbi:MAG: diaminopimelate epimerase [Chloroflexi bacterium]|nr:diaminopimelate epimerase [Chloroflexota bacterium]
MAIPAQVPFWKMHGTGNDFVLTDALPAEDGALPALARAVCDRHFGVGADGLILVLPSTRADLRMRIFNADGSEAEMCGNGIRCFTRFALERGLAAPGDGALRVETGAGVLTAQAQRDSGGAVRVAMGAPRLAPHDVGARIEAVAPVLDLPLEVGGHALALTLVSMGNPHAVHLLDDGADLDAFPLATVGPLVEHDPLFANRTNFEVVRVHDRGRIALRVWERGVGETLACGTGACATVVAARLHRLVDDAVDVQLPGGTLRIEWDGAREVHLIGPAARVFASTWEDSTSREWGA